MMLTTPYPMLYINKSSLKQGVQSQNHYLDVNITYNKSGGELFYSGLIYINYGDDGGSNEVFVTEQDIIETNEAFLDFDNSIIELDTNQVQEYTKYDNLPSEIYAVSYEANSNDDTNVSQIYKTDTRDLTKSYDEDDLMLSSVKSLNLSWDNQYTDLDKTEEDNTSPDGPNEVIDSILYSGDDINQDLQKIVVVDAGVTTQGVDDNGKSQNKPPNRKWDATLIDETKTEACEQLMLLDSDSNKHTNTIIYTGNEKSGETIQEIVVNDPDVECRHIKTRAKKSSAPGQNKKKYQCNKCKQCFNTMPSFKLHLVDMISRNQKGRKVTKKSENQPILSCEECGKTFHCPKKLEKHNSGHGNPDRECEVCAKVFASKSTLRTHRAIHLRKYQCKNCPKTFSKQKDFTAHQGKAHSKYDCTECSFTTKNYKVFEDHKQYHEEPELLNESLNNDNANESDIIIINATKDVDELSSHDSGVNLYSEEISSPEQEDYLCLDSNLENVDTTIFDNIDNDLSYTDNATYSYNIENDELFRSIDNVFDDAELDYFESVTNDTNFELSPEYDSQGTSITYNTETADSIMDLVRKDSLFFSDMKYKRTANGKYKKTCSICSKSFERMTDLKRHYIEHIVQCALAKNPTNSSGHLALKCEFCDGNTFDKIETYKAHLREHAKLTNYKCILCNKSFSDSSNFAKHKKVHNNDFFQCDLCLRKFTSKKMIIKHMEIHQKTEPINCIYCGQLFFFESILKKHYKTKHTKSIVYKCFFCSELFHNLKRKWDHEWKIHNSRKNAIDCMLCKKKFRKYSDLKKHCLKSHNIAAPKLKSLNKNK